MARVTITGADQWTDAVPIGIGKAYDVHVHTNSGFSGSVVVQRRRNDTTEWINVDGETYTDVADRVGRVATIGWDFRIGSPDGSGSIVAEIWAD